MFCKPLQDRRLPSAVVSKGSIYAAMQQDGTPRVLNGNSTSSTQGDGPSQLTPARHHESLPLNHRATPNSDDTSDPDVASNTSFDTGVSGHTVVVVAVIQ